MITIVLPVYNEADNIAPCLRGLWDALRELPHEILICYDFDADSTLPAIRNMPDCPPTVRLVKNDLGRGVAFALRAGFSAARGDVIVTTMADLSDPPAVIPRMAEKIRAGADVVSGSRYMPGGSQTGGPLLKGLLSRMAGLALRYIAGLRTHDATTNFRAYRARFLQQTPVESQLGFEVALELTVKAHLHGFRIDQVPSSWHDRTAGQSNFKLWKWLPRYLHWFGRAMLTPMIVWTAFLAATIAAFFQVHPAFAASSAIAALLLILLARRLRGRMTPLDLAFPLALVTVALLGA